MQFSIILISLIAGLIAASPVQQVRKSPCDREAGMIPYCCDNVGPGMFSRDDCFGGILL